MVVLLKVVRTGIEPFCSLFFFEKTFKYNDSCIIVKSEPESKHPITRFWPINVLTKTFLSVTGSSITFPVKFLVIWQAVAEIYG